MSSITPQQHIDQYRSNKRFIDYLIKDNCKHYDWITTIPFYAALHLVDKCLAGKKCFP